MKTSSLSFKKNIRIIAFLFDLISPIVLYLFLVSGRMLLNTIIFAIITLVRIIYVMISK